MKHNSPLVFINYRRDDAGTEAGRLAGDLEKHFGNGFVFQDVDDIQSGDKWIDALEKAGAQAKVTLAVIGPDWLQKNEAGKSRLSDPSDWVRRELESTIANRKIIIPVLVNGATIPPEADLPESLKPILGHQARSIRTQEWNHDKLQLFNEVRNITGVKPIDPYKWKKIAFAAIVILSLLGGIGYFVLDSKQDIRTMPSINFCPDFSQEVDIKTLLFPFTRSNGTMEEIIQRRFIEMCSKYNVTADFGIANTKKGKYFDQQSAKQKCPECAPDIFLTGLSYENSPGKYGVQADFGFCNSTFEGYGIDEDKLDITFDNITFGTLSTDPAVESSIQHVIQIYIGMFLAKKGDFNKSNKVLEQAVEELPLDNKLKTEAYKVIWQNDYKLGNKEKCIETLDKIYQLNPNNLKAVTASSIIALDQAKYDKAITGFTSVINKTSQPSKKDKLLEKRGDAYFKNNQLKQAKDDYKRVNNRPEVNKKIENVDIKIRKNETSITNLTAKMSSLTTNNRLRLIDLLVQNGNDEKAIKTVKNMNEPELRDINISRLNPNTVKLIRAHVINNNL